MKQLDGRLTSALHTDHRPTTLTYTIDPTQTEKGTFAGMPREFAGSIK